MCVYFNLLLHCTLPSVRLKLLFKNKQKENKLIFEMDKDSSAIQKKITTEVEQFKSAQKGMTSIASVLIRTFCLHFCRIKS